MRTIKHERAKLKHSQACKDLKHLPPNPYILSEEGI